MSLSNSYLISTFQVRKASRLQPEEIPDNGRDGFDQLVSDVRGVSTIFKPLIRRDKCKLYLFRGLKNDSTPEVFELKHKTFENEDFPVLFIQVIPLLSYGPSFNFSIWYIELLGLEDDLIVCNTLQNYNEQKEKTTIRLILKHLRSKGHFDAFDALSRETNIQLEDLEVTELYRCLVDAGDFQKVEDIMEKLIDGKKILILF